MPPTPAFWLKFLPLLALWLAVNPALAGPAPGKSQSLTRPDQVPDGLAKTDWASIRAAYEAGRHSFQPTATGWQARNPGQQWTTQFDRRGFLAAPRDGGWTWGLELQSYGFPGAERAIHGVPAVQADGQRLTYQWDGTVQEWFVNDPRGLEHGFTVKERPAGSSQQQALHTQPSTLNFLLAPRGTLTPAITEDAKGVLFRDAAGATVLNYTGLKVWDADGKVLPSRFELADAQPSTLNSQSSVRLLVEERGARYPLTIDPIAQQAYLKAHQVTVDDIFGYSVAVSGDTVVVGAPYEDSSTTGVNGVSNELASASGAAYVFVRSGTTWSQQAYLKPAAVGTTQAGDHFGWSVAVSGDTVVVGARQEDSSTTGVNSTANESTTTGANSGAAYVFVRSGTTWSQQAYLKPAAVGTTQAGDNFGYSVAVSGDTVVVGARQEDSSTTGVSSTANESTTTGTNSGAAYVFVRSGTTWSQQAYLKPAAVGTTQADDNFGYSVAVSGDTVVVGAYQEDSSTTGVNSTANQSTTTGVDSGAAYVFVRSGTTWSQQAYLKPAAVGTTQASDNFGWSVAVSGDTVVVGAVNEDSSTTGVNSTANELALVSGAAYVFVRSGTTWSQQAYLKAHQVSLDDRFGYSVAVSGDTVVVGATLEAGSTPGVNGVTNELAAGSGAAYVFVRSGTTWSQQAYLKAHQVSADDEFGRSVAVSGDTVVVGALNEDSSTTGVNGVTNESASASGAAYIFTGLGLPAEITVHGNGVPIPAGTSAPSLADHTDFGGAALTGGTVVRTFTITNDGTSALTLSGTPLVAVSGTHAADFTVTALPTSPVAVGGSTTFQVTFDPSASGIRTATLTIANNDSDEGTYTFALQGTGVNAPTVILPIADLVVNEDAPSVVTNLTLHFSDVETPATDLTYVLVANTNSALVGATITQGTNLVLTFATNGNGTSQISVSATDAGGLSVTNVFVVTVNPVSDPPVATSATYARAPGLTLKIPIAAIVSDPNSLTVAVQSLGTSAQSATLSFNSTYIFYVPANHNNDSFIYTVTNTVGESASATLTVTVATVGGSAKTITVVEGNATVRFFGIPGLTYDVQRTASLSAPVTWTTLTTGSALAPGADGAFSHTDTNAPNGTAYYRSAPR